LLPGKDADGGVVAKLFFGPYSKPRADAVIPAQRVAAGENEASGFGLSHGNPYKSNRRSFDSLRSG
jgi:hypothetical protein